MKCASCNAEISDKAIVCFRCGASTTDPVRKAVSVKPKRSPWLLTVVVLAFVLLAAYFWQMSRTAADPELPELVAGVALGVAVVVAFTWFFRRR